MIFKSDFVGPCHVSLTNLLWYTIFTHDPCPKLYVYHVKIPISFYIESYTVTQCSLLKIYNTAVHRLYTIYVKFELKV